MKYRKLGKTGIEVSEIALGTWQLGGGWGKPFDNRVARKILEAAYKTGINFLDTADVYDDQQSEQMVGAFTGEFRDQLYIATKIGRRINPHISKGYTPEVLEDYVDQALINTGLEYLDLVQLHCPPTPVYYRDEIFRKLEEIKSSGRVRHFGVSVETVEEALQATTYEVVETVQIIFNMFRLKPLDACFKVLSSRNIGIIARVPLASGLLAGKITPDTVYEKEDHRYFNRNGEAFDKGETFSGVPLDVAFEALEDLTTRFDRAQLYQVALKWVLMFPEVSTVIPGASRPEQVIANVEALEWPELSQNDMDFIFKIYNSRIRQHVHDLW
jgi:aryl-alcohol dehydrogenase-like predicted oxidoreductase